MGALGSNPLAQNLVTKIFRGDPDDDDQDPQNGEPSKLNLSSCYFPPWVQTKESRILEEGSRRIEKNLDVANFLIRFMMLWRKFKTDLKPY